MQQMSVQQSLNVDNDMEQLAGLKAEHAALKRRLADFEHHRYLTSTEEIERRRLQKLKLLAKDRMTILERRVSG